MKIIGWRPANCGLEELCMGTACDFGWLGLFISRWKTVGLQGLSRGGTHACAGPSGPPGTLGRGGSQVASAEDEKSLTLNASRQLGKERRGMHIPGSTTHLQYCACLQREQRRRPTAR